MSIKIEDLYLNTPIPRYEYMRLKLSNLPEDFIHQYNLMGKVAKDDYIYTEIRRGMYGLPEAGILSQRILEKRMNKEWYKQIQVTPGFWTHDWLPVSFSLCVYDFGVKYVGKEHADHLMVVLSKRYNILSNWEGKRYLGLDLDWDYEKREVNLSMLTYVNNTLKRFNHKKPRKPQNQPYPHTKTVYGAKAQISKPEDMSEILSQAYKKFIQEVTGTFLYYARSVDATMLPALGSIASQQANPTERTMLKAKQLLDYSAMQPNAIITYRASDKVLSGHSDASYLSEFKSQSRAGGHFSWRTSRQIRPTMVLSLTISQIIKAVMSSAAEAELCALFVNWREVIQERIVLEEMVHKKLPMPMQTDNTTAIGVANNNIVSKRLKSMDMRFNWMRCRIA